MKEQILKLRSEGKTYNEIKKKLGCSKGTISYHCGDGQKEKSSARQKLNKKTIKRIIRTKVDRFLWSRIHNFKRGRTWEKTDARFDYDSAYKKIFYNPVCYLTGRKIDISSPLTYELDHIISVARGGKNTLANMGLACKEANRGKSEISLDEFIKLCKDVCENHGYNVIKKEN